MSIRWAVLCSLGWWLTACSQEPEPKAPPLPPLQLASTKPQLESMAKQAADPGEVERRQIRELFQAAYGAEATDRRLAVRSEQSLLDRADAWWGYQQGLLDSDAGAREVSARVIAERRWFVCLPALILRLKYETDARVKIAVITAVAKFGNGSGLRLLTPMFQQENVADLAGQATIQLLQDADVDPGEAPTWDILSKHLESLAAKWRSGEAFTKTAPTPEQLSALEAALARHLLATDGFQLRNVDDARFILARSGALALPALRLALTAQEPYLRQHALEVLVELGPVGATLSDSVIPLLGDPLVESAAVLALGAIRAKSAMPHLLWRLSKGEPEFRASAAESLGNLSDAGAIDALRKTLDSQDELLDVRVRAATSLARLQRGGPGLAFLQELEQRAGYHAPTLAACLERARQVD